MEVWRPVPFDTQPKLAKIRAPSGGVAWNVGVAMDSIKDIGHPVQFYTQCKPRPQRRPTPPVLDPARGYRISHIVARRPDRALTVQNSAQRSRGFALGVTQARESRAHETQRLHERDANE